MVILLAVDRGNTTSFFLLQGLDSGWTSCTSKTFSNNNPLLQSQLLFATIPVRLGTPMCVLNDDDPSSNCNLSDPALIAQITERLGCTIIDKREV